MADWALWLAAVRGLAGTVTFGYASVTDLRTRRVDNRLWLAVGGLGALLLAVQFWTVGFQQPLLLVSIPIAAGLAYLLYQTGLLFGGADAKALMALALLVPFHSGLPGVPFLASPLTAFIFPFAVFANALLVTLLYPPALLSINVLRGDLAFPESLVGTRLDVDELDSAWAWPMERIEDGEIVRSYMPSRSATEVEAEALREAGLERVWVTPKIPFMIPLAVGFVSAFLFGDLLSAIVQAVIPV